MLLLVHGNDHALFRAFFNGVRFWHIKFDARLQDGGCDHEYDQENQHDVHEGDHVDLGE
jgi:hypothetical protein